MEEIWKPVVGYEGIYEVSSFGRVRSVDRIDNNNRKRFGRILTQELGNTGYYRVHLCKNNIRKHTSVHRLVAQAFIPNPYNLPQVNHKDECYTNNCITNLEWCYTKYNVNYGTAIQRKKIKMKNHPSHSKKVDRYDLDGNYIDSWPSTKEIERVLGIPNTHISACCIGKKHHKTAGGFKFKYAS